jgi:hypothetical protein
MTRLSTSLTGLMRTSPNLFPRPLLGRGLVLSFLPRPPMSLRGRFGLSNTCC